LVAELNHNSQTTGVSTQVGDNSAMVQTSIAKSVITDLALPPVSTTVDQFKEFLSHPFLAVHMSWVFASINSLVTDDIVAYFFANAPATLLSKLSNFMFFRAKIKVKVVVQGAPQAAGKMIIACTPLPLPDYTTSGTSVVASGAVSTFKIVPTIEVDPSKSTSYELILPVCTVGGVYTTPAALNQAGSYRLETFIINNIVSGTATASVVSVCIYLSLEDIEFEGLTLLSSGYVSRAAEIVLPHDSIYTEKIQTFLSNSFEEEKKQGGSYSSVAQGLSSISSNIGSVFPSLMPATTLFSTVASAAGNILSFFGFSKPPVIENQLFVMNRQNDNYSQYDGTSTALVLAASQKTSLGISEDLGQNSDDMLISKLVSKEGYFQLSLIVTQALANGALVNTIAVSPGLSLTIGSVFMPPLCAIGRMFEYWRGDINITVEFVTSIYHRASFLFAWDPAAFTASTPPTLAQALTTLKNFTVDISGNRTIKIKIPYKQQFPWTQFNLSNNATINNCNGVLYMFVINPVTANGSTDGMYVNFLLSSDNIKFAVPSPASTDTVLYAAQTFLSSGYFPNNQVFLSNLFCPVENVSFGPDTDLSLACVRSFGEDYTSVKQLACKVSVQYAPITLINPGANVLQEWNFPNVPILPSSTYTTPASLRNTFTDYLAPAFVGFRGSLRWTFNAMMSGGGNVMNNYCPSHDADLSVPVPFGNMSTPNGIRGTSYAWNTMNPAISPNCDIVAPMLIPSYFIPTKSVLSQSLDEVSIALMGDSNTIATSHLNLYVYKGAGDDASFIWFTGFPGMSHL